MQPELTIMALSLWMIVVFAVTAVVYSMVFIWKEIRRFGWPLRAIIWLPLAIAGSYIVIALLTGYVQTARSLKQSPTLYRYER